MKKIFITGVNGFIGRNLCKFLIDKKFIVYGIDNFFSSNRNDLKELKDPNFHFEEKSILDNNIYDFVQDRIDIVIHLAAQTSVFKSLKNPDLNNLININGFENIFYQSKKLGVESFFFASSSSVYGDTENKKIDENFKLKPAHYYAYTKFIGEKMIQSYLKLLKILTKSIKLHLVKL